MSKSKQRWEKVKRNLSDEDQYLSNIVEARIHSLHENGEVITEELIRNTINRLMKSKEFKYLLLYLVDKYRK